MRGEQGEGRDRGEGEMNVRSRSPSLHEENQENEYTKAEVERCFMGTCVVSWDCRDLGRRQHDDGTGKFARG